MHMTTCFYRYRPEVSSTMRALDLYALALDQGPVSAIITLLNNSEHLLNQKWLHPVTKKSNASIG